jgi:hypothetical protein
MWLCAILIQFWALYYKSEYYISQLPGLLRNATHTKKEHQPIIDPRDLLSLIVSYCDL